MAPYGLVNDFVNRETGLIGEAEVLETQHDVGAVEQADDDLLTVDRRQRRHAHVDRTPADDQTDTAVLRDAPLGDVEVGHDLETREHALLQALRDGHGLVQHAVVAEADQQVFRLGLEVDVRRPFVGRTGKHAVDELDHRRGVDLLADVAQFALADVVIAFAL